MDLGFLRPDGRGLALAFALAIAMLCGATAAQAAGGKRDALVVVNDRGGLLGERSAKIRTLAMTGQRVELRGTCLSACTMYLALSNACVAPGASFGFHGPSWYGAPLAPQDFEHWSQVMADHYNPPLRAWYMKTARHRITSYYMMRGAELIRLGYAPC